ncbi:hypothetical protein CPC08DRAFT_752389 [Agrocybe pediades]|nr:hypothetical protein CPC08DRAFT_752389 [Agrocybe pediades]
MKCYAFSSYLPNDIQRSIFQTAAKSDGRVAITLSLVSRQVRSWVEQYMYARVVIPHSHSARCFLHLVKSKPKGSFDPLIKYLAIGKEVSPNLAKFILAECSRRVLHFTCFSHNNFTTNPLPGYIRSPNLRSLLMIFSRDDNHEAFHKVPYELLPQTQSMLTRLAIVIDYNHSTWPALLSALTGFMDPHLDAYKDSLSAFQKLTHFAISSQRLKASIAILRVAPNLRYFAVLEMENLEPDERIDLISFARQRRHRALVFIRSLGNPDAWRVNDEFAHVTYNFWERVEQLVEGGFITDTGEMW